MRSRFLLGTIIFLLVSLYVQVGNVNPAYAATCTATSDAELTTHLGNPTCTEIVVQAGGYSAITIDRAVTIIGAGKGSTVIAGVTINAGGVTLRDMSLSGPQYGILINTTTPISGITLENIAADNNGHTGFFVDNDTTVSNVTIRNSSFSNNTYLGFYMLHDASMNGLYVENSAFDGNHDGFYIRNWWTTGSRTDDVFNDITVLNSTFNNNKHKGMYFEKLSNALFEGITVDHSGYTGLAWDVGIDINLKYGSYSNIEFRNSSVTNSGTGDTTNGAGITIKQRNDSSSYNTNPASLNDVRLTCVTMTGNQTGIRFGEPGKTTTTPTNVEVRYSTLMNNIDEDAENTGTTAVDAINNWWGSEDGPAAGRVVGNITYAPWLNAPPPCPIGGAGSEIVKCTTKFEFGTADEAPVNGDVRLYTHFAPETTAQPEGRMVNSIPVIQGSKVEGVMTEVDCGVYVRAWLFNDQSYTVGLLPSQYENGDGVFVPVTEDYGAGDGEISPLYAATFAHLIQPVGDKAEPNLSDGVIVTTDQDDGAVEWAKWTKDGAYVTLGWTWEQPDGSVKCAVREFTPYDYATFAEIVAKHGIHCKPFEEKAE